jgi:hypothetical protein
MLAIAPIAGCEVIRDVGEFCSQETLAVTTTADIRRPCDAAECSLWGAIAAANTCSSGMTVTIPAGSRIVFGAPPPDAGTTPAETIFPAISGRLVIQGNGAELGRLPAAGVPPDRYFFIRPSGDLTISNLSLQGGGGDSGPSFGGAFLNHGALTLQDVDIAASRAGTGGAIDNRGRLTIRGGRYLDNRASGCDEHGGGAIRNAEGAVATIAGSGFTANQGCGGAIYNQGRIDVTGASFADNRGGSGDDNTYNHGGAIYNETVGAAAQATVVGSTFSGNRAMVGAAIVNARGTSLSLQSSTLSGNVAHLPCPRCLEEEEHERPHAAASAGITHFGGELELVDVTIFANTCEDALPACGGGIVFTGDSGSVSFRNTLIAGHPDGDCGRVAGLSALPRLDASGANLDSDRSCPGFTVHQPPLLGPLADNGGPTRTQAVLPGSPALDAGTGCLAQDQRGEPRARSAADPCDLGAFELQR